MPLTIEKVREGAGGTDDSPRELTKPISDVQSDVGGKVEEAVGSAERLNVLKVVPTEAIYFNPDEPQDGRIKQFFIGVLCGGKQFMFIRYGDPKSYLTEAPQWLREELKDSYGLELTTSLLGVRLIKQKDINIDPSEKGGRPIATSAASEERQ